MYHFVFNSVAWPAISLWRVIVFTGVDCLSRSLWLRDGLLSGVTWPSRAPWGLSRDLLFLNDWRGWLIRRKSISSVAGPASHPRLLGFFGCDFLLYLVLGLWHFVKNFLDVFANEALDVIHSAGGFLICNDYLLLIRLSCFLIRYLFHVAGPASYPWLPGRNLFYLWLKFNFWSFFSLLFDLSWVYWVLYTCHLWGPRAVRGWYQFLPLIGMFFFYLAQLIVKQDSLILLAGS